nr:histidine kinase [uncultured Caldimonas sp.]
MQADTPTDRAPNDLLRQHAVVVAALVVGLCVLLVVTGPRSDRLFWRMLVPVTLLTLAGAFAAASAVPRRWSTHPLAYPAFGAGGAWLGSVVGLSISASLRHRTLEFMASRPVFWESMAAALVTGTLIGATLWWLASLRERERLHAEQLVSYRLDALRNQAVAAQAESERSRIGLHLLQAQVEPHFLYNVLANLRYLVRHDREQATRLIDQLIRYFRAVLPSLRAVEVSLAQELELCRALSEIQAIRAGGRLQVTIDAEPLLAAARVPPAMLLTLLENAFKHGEPHDGELPRVSITARAEGAELRLEVVDNGPGPAASSSTTGSGEGLRWLSDRLRLAYGPRGSLHLAHAPGGGCIARLTLPLTFESLAA